MPIMPINTKEMYITVIRLPGKREVPIQGNL